MHRILGIDPGSVVTGYGVIEVVGNQARLCEAGCLRLSGEDVGQRLSQIFHGLGEIIERTQPQEMAVETVFVNKNPASAIKLGQARGAAICAGAAVRLPLAEYTPARVKQAIVGRGRAEKRQIQHMVRVLLNLQQHLAADAADAVAVALCHWHHSQTAARAARAV